MQLHEEIRQAGFYIKQQDDSCERFAVIDQEVVWYGGVNLLAKSDAEQSIMRVPSKKIAAELMELSFGTKDSWNLHHYTNFYTIWNSLGNNLWQVMKNRAFEEPANNSL